MDTSHVLALGAVVLLAALLLRLVVVLPKRRAEAGQKKKKEDEEPVNQSRPSVLSSSSGSGTKPLWEICIHLLLIAVHKALS